jgi:hypothetical protein
VVLLTAHSVIPAASPDAGLARITALARQHPDAVLMSGLLQVTGAILYVAFVLAIVHLASAGERFAGRIVPLAATILVALRLLDSAAIICAAQSAQHGQTETLRVSFDPIGGPATTTSNAPS